MRCESYLAKNDCGFIFDPHTPSLGKWTLIWFFVLFPILLSSISCAASILPTSPNSSVNCWEVNEDPRGLCVQLYSIDPDVAMEVSKLPEFRGEIGDPQIRAIGRFLKVLANASYLEKPNLTRLLSSGMPKVRKYCTPLQGIFWVLEKEDDENILTYSLETLLDKAWDFSDSRWEEYETVTDRLNSPRLIDYYQRKRLVFVRYSEHPWNPRWLFKSNRGSCIEFTSFSLVCLKKAGIRLRFITCHGNPTGFWGSIGQPFSKVKMAAFMSWITEDPTPRA